VGLLRERDQTVPKYVIERVIPNAGQWSAEEIEAAARTSVAALNELGSQIQWVHSYVTGDRIYCIYIAPNEDLVREHARLAGFPADRVSEIRAVLDPTSAER
jgi:hypothetical protein